MSAPAYLSIAACPGLLAVGLLAFGAESQTTGGQDMGSQGTNQGPVMQETPAATLPGARSAPLGDAEFVTAAWIGNKFEIEEGQLALAHASNPRLKAFARMVVDDYGAALKELESVARSANLGLPSALDEAHGAMIRALTARKGAGFDQQYIAHQKQAHEQTLALLVSYENDGKSELLKAWVAKVLPTVRKHHQAIVSMTAP